MSVENRKSERFEAIYAITVRAHGASAAQAFAKAHMTNLSKGGLCFLNPYPLERGQRMEIDFPSLKPVVKLTAQVVWCRPQRDEFSVGAEFFSMTEALRARLVEMHHAIADYHRLKGDAAMDFRQATEEWCGLYAMKFLSSAR